MMLTTRDRENRVNTAQSSKGGFSKTPGGKLNENELAVLNQGGKNGFKAQADIFKTPLGPRGRVPLGGKDTNVKAKTTITINDPTNKPGKATPSSTKKRARRATRLSVTQAKELTEEDDDVPEIEYMPPAPKELPDIPEDYVRVNMGNIKQNLFKDVSSTPQYTAKQREQFKKLTYHDERKEEEDVLNELESLVSDMKVGLEDEGAKPALKKKASGYSGATKSSLAKQGPSRPPSANSTRPGSAGAVRPPSATSVRPPSATSVRPPSAGAVRPPSRPMSACAVKPVPSTGPVRPVRSQWIKPQPDGSCANSKDLIPVKSKEPNPLCVGGYYADPDHYYKDPRPDKNGVYHPLGKHGLYTARLTPKVATILSEEMETVLAALQSGEATKNDFDMAAMEEDVLQRAEKPSYPPKYDFEARMRELFRMDEPEDEEVYQIPTDE
ncbi:hypothetical protein TWF481_003815 [Arthrobotrys musiformis]|uniref:Uncharacterized protein n=1 Tax=Arthrobotrys musiformis TaxID=47236 RepID=A0AAV9WJM7_9PEZI